MHDIPGKVLWTVVCVFILLGLFGITVVEGELLDKRDLYVDMCDFVDGVVDSRVITDAELQAFNTQIASYGFSVDYTIERYVRAVNPDPLNEGEVVPTWIMVDDNRNYNQGDKIVLHVWSIGGTRSGNLLSGLNLFRTSKFDRTVPARVR